MKIVYFGSDIFSIFIFRTLLTTSHTIAAIVTTPDKKRGRGQHLSDSPLKNVAHEYEIPCLQPATLKDDECVAQLRAIDADLFVVIGYGKILPSEILNVPKLYCVNIHPSLLPLYRGSSPIQYTLLNGDAEAGFTIIKLNERIDCGDILFQEAMRIDGDINAYELTDELAARAGHRLSTVLESVEKGSVSLLPQSESRASYARRFKKNDGLIDWRKDKCEIHNMVRALMLWPCAYTHFHDKTLKIYRTRVRGQGASIDTMPAGAIVDINKGGWIAVKSGSGYVELQEVQYAGKTRMSAFEWAKGQHIQRGDQLG